MQRSSSGIFPGASLLQAVITAGVGVVMFAAMDGYRRIQTHKAH